MSRQRSTAAEKPRELRRRVVVPARLRHGASWSDACILNISSRGLMIHSGRPIVQGTEVEIRRGDNVIVARVVWRDGGRAGLHVEGRVPIEEIMSFGQSQVLPLLRVDRRKEPRAEERSRLRGRVIEFAGAAVIAASLAGAGLMMVEAAFARPLALVEAALAP